MRKMYILFATVLVVGLLFWTPVALADEEDPPARWRSRFIAGEVIAAGTRTLILETERGEFPVVTGEKTAFRVPGTDQASFGDIAVGDHVVILGRRVGLAGYARLIAVVEPETRLGRAGGQVTGIADGSISVETRDGEAATISTDPTTVYFAPGEGEIEPDQVQVGQIVMCGGLREEGADTLDALLVIVRDGDREAE